MTVTEETIKRTLDLKLPENDAPTVRDYLVKLLHDVWLHEEDFDGKRPFGNSGWQHDVYVPMVAADIVEGLLDHDGFIEQFDEHHAEQIVLAAIDSLARPPRPSNLVL